MTDYYFAARWTVALLGIIPAVWFLATCRPSRWGRAAQVDASGWVIVVLGFYVISIVGLAAGAHQPSVIGGTATLVWTAVADGILWYRAIRWRLIRASLAEPKRRVTDHLDDEPTHQEQ